MSLHRRRRGFVLVGVMALLTVVATVIFLSTADARLAVAAINGRTATARLEWTARGCLADVRAALDAELAGAGEGPSRDLVWRQVGRTLAPHVSRRQGACEVTAEPFGVRADVNALDSLGLARLLGASFGDGADTIVAAVLDWRDADDTRRAGGAEWSWYEEHGRYGPSDAPFVSEDEFELVRGLEGRPEVRALLTTERELISLTHAPPEVLAAVAGEDPLVLSLLLEARSRATPGQDLRDLFSARDTSVARRAAEQYGALQSRISVEPVAWRLTAHARDEATALEVTVEQRVTRTLSHVIISAERVR
jgi:type II secretory pathway component PulK